MNPETELQKVSLFLNGSGVEIQAELEVPADLSDSQLTEFIQTVLAQDSSRGGWIAFGDIVIHYGAVAAFVPR